MRERALLTRLGIFLDHFVGGVGRRAHRTYASRYLQGLLNDSERKPMEPMRRRLSDPGSYQGLQHFITHSSGAVRPFWPRLRTLLPVRHGILALDDTGLSQAGDGGGRKIANCQIAVSTALIARGLAVPCLRDPAEWVQRHHILSSAPQMR